ncbi:hypothetical protein QBC34DRAFT_352357 [Podospora aff. communis PSN243]|uniref:Rhodopsin domain-containing protein n=1 Tax=Podospora aff. communis PSN243 TaxID=3040156 RepID=A0AAV9GL64_9PEZI|nr:hypothetical protein QBC34DRAFT_352357 [Podospora aff. communis PSN243]
MDTEETNGPRIVISLSVLTCISFLTMLTRFFCKARCAKGLGWDDHLLSISWTCVLIYSGITSAAVTHGIGHHRATIPPESLVMAMRLLYAARFFGIIALAVSKSSFVLTLLPLAKLPWQRNILWFIIVSLNLIVWICGFAFFFQCSPTRRAWDFAVSGTCWSPAAQAGVGILAGAYSAAMGFVLTLFPIILIRNLSMEKWEKIGVLLIMSLGIFASIAGIIKSHLLTTTARSTDFTFSSADLLIWSAAETAIVIMAVSLPSLGLVIKELFPTSRTPTEPRTEQKGWRFRLGGKYETLDDDWITGAGNPDGGPRRGRLVMRDGKATVAYQ